MRRARHGLAACACRAGTAGDEAAGRGLGGGPLASDSGLNRMCAAPATESVSMFLKQLPPGWPTEAHCPPTVRPAVPRPAPPRPAPPRPAVRSAPRLAGIRHRGCLHQQSGGALCTHCLCAVHHTLPPGAALFPILFFSSVVPFVHTRETSSLGAVLVWEPPCTLTKGRAQARSPSPALHAAAAEPSWAAAPTLLWLRLWLHRGWW